MKIQMDAKRAIKWLEWRGGGEVRGSKCWAGKKNWRGFEKKCKDFENRVKSF